MRSILRISALLACSATAPSCGASADGAAAVHAGDSRVERGSVPGIELIGTASIPGDARDRSGLGGVLEDGTPRDILGAFGSGIAWTGSGTRYVSVCDRGPKDGATTFADRLEWFDMSVDPTRMPAFELALLETTLLTDESGRQLTGSTAAFDVEHPERGLRFDPESVRVSNRGTLFISDEYGPWIVEVTVSGRIMRRLAVPPEFSCAVPAVANEEKLGANKKGRVSNRGFEGLALAPDCKTLFALPQGALIQDGGRKGRTCRLLQIDVESGATRTFAVVLDDATRSFNEIVAVDDHRFLAIERDHEAGKKARVKRVELLDIRGASDVSKLEQLDGDELPAGVVPVAKARFIDLLVERFGLAGGTFPEKIEGLTFGPDLHDGRHLLIVASDNDQENSSPSWFYAFAISKNALPGFTPQSSFGPK